MNRAWSKSEASAIVGCCERTMDRLIAAGTIKAHRVGNRWRIFQSDIDEFLEAGSNKRLTPVGSDPHTSAELMAGAAVHA